MAHLITVPTFFFEQGDRFQEENPSEYPIQVSYYNGSIELGQNGNSVLIHPDFFERLVKEIRRHRPEAEAKLNR